MSNEISFYDEPPPDKDVGPTVLIVDDDEPDRERIKDFCLSTDEGKHLHIITSASIEGALKVIASAPVHVVLLDKNFKMGSGLPPRNGIEAIPKMLDMQPHLQILVITATEIKEAATDAVKAMRLGACGYVLKDYPAPLLVAEINRAINVAHVFIDKVRRERGNPFVSPIHLVGKSEAAKYLQEQVQAMAESRCPVLLLGPTGTGKTTIARMLNQRRKTYLKQADRPFFSLHLGSMAPNLIESELFGYEKGAFTGAVTSKQGFFELANWGTLFLDEIGEINGDLQVKLLKVLDKHGTFRRVGGTEEFSSKFRLISATNKELDQLVAEGRFREDLYRRISTLIIRVPALSERKEDIPDIIRAVLPECCHDTNTFIQFEDLPKDFVDALTEDPPEGNIRGLIEQVSRLLVFCQKDNGRPRLKNWREVPGLTPRRSARSRSTITLSDLTNLPFDVVPENRDTAFPGLTDLVETVADRIVEDAQRKFKKQSDVARALKISKSAAHYRLKRIEQPTPSVQNEVEPPAEVPMLGNQLGVGIG